MRPPKKHRGVGTKLALIVVIGLILAFSVYYVRLLRAVHQESNSTVNDFTGGKNVSVANSGINFESIYWPVVLIGVGFTNSSFDPPFMQMLRQLGVQTIAIETDPTFFRTYESRFASVISLARSDGFKIHIINQLGYASWYKLLGLSLPFSSAPSFQQFEQFETQAMQEYAKYKPDYLSVIAEPGLMQTKIQTSFTPEQWQSLVQSLCETVISISPNTKTWIDLVPQMSFDMQILPNLVSVTQLTGIGLDIYGNASPVSTTTNAASFITSHGKLGGITETWAFSLYADPSTDTSANVPAQASWLSANGIVQFAIQRNLTAIFDPFFSNKFTSLAPLPEFSNAGLESEANLFMQSLEANQTTSIFQAYHDLIIQAG